MNKMYGCQQCEIYDNQFSTEGEGRPQCSVFIGAGTGMVFNNTVTGPRNWRIILLANHRAHGVMTEPFGKADGTSPFDGNQIPAGQVGAGYPCMGQVGRATNLKGTGVFESTPAYCWNNTIDGKELRMAVSGRDPNEAAQIKEGRDFFNEKPPGEYYKPYVYPHPLQEGWDALMKSVAVGSAPMHRSERDDDRFRTRHRSGQTVRRRRRSCTGSTSTGVHPLYGSRRRYRR
jgi:hypothetical protein